MIPEKHIPHQIYVKNTKLKNAWIYKFVLAGTHGCLSFTNKREKEAQADALLGLSS